MSHKDYELIAGILKSFECEGPLYLDLVSAFCVNLAKANPRFDAKRFATASGMPAELLPWLFQSMMKGN